MKKALLAAICFIIVCLVLVNGVPSPDNLTGWLEGIDLSLPAPPVSSKPVRVKLVSDDTPQSLFPGGLATRTSYVLNEGEGAVCFRIAYAIQYDAETWPHLSIRFVAPGYEESDWLPITIDSTPYVMKVLTYPQTLAPGEASPGVLFGVAMDTTVTSEQLSRYRPDFMRMRVLAIDPSPFYSNEVTTVPQVLDTALPLNELTPF